MWGCIGFYGMKDSTLIVPSLYVRVYRASMFHQPPILGSLIICEGVSEKGVLSFLYDVFPHYMWGCIALKIILTAAAIVPSLYVRVYRLDFKAFPWISCSLIICEGVSVIYEEDLYTSQFPHYMWGCIGIGTALLQDAMVPSLYVRVYRTFFATLCVSPSSLIICEGVSFCRGLLAVLCSFPHYMWGCIG